jgi:probable F420-dependent oxidoreductase
MKVGVIPINVGVRDPERLVSLVRKAEEVGLESAWTFEHVIVPADYQSRYPYSAEGKMGATPETPFVDPLIALTFAAAHTKTLRFATGINILPQTNPLLMAKQVASLDMLSGGRFMLGVGTGWLREEFDALGVPFERRGARFDDYITAMKKVWSGELVEHEGEFVRFHNFKSYPLPPQRPHPPIIIGGTSRAAFARVVKHGDGWFAPSAGADGLAKQLKELHEVARELGRDPATIEITAMWTYALEGADSRKRYEDMGVSRLIVPTMALGGRTPLEGLEKLGEQLASSR